MVDTLDCTVEEASLEQASLVEAFEQASLVEASLVEEAFLGFGLWVSYIVGTVSVLWVEYYMVDTAPVRLVADADYKIVVLVAVVHTVVNKVHIRNSCTARTYRMLISCSMLNHGSGPLNIHIYMQISK